MIDTAQLVHEVMDGDTSPYKALHFLKNHYKEVKKQIEIIEIEAFNQCEYEDKNFNADGFEIEKRNGRKVWNFKKCNSYIIAKDNLTEIEDNLKASYSANEKGLNMIDNDGVVVELPLVTFTKDSLIIKKK